MLKPLTRATLTQQTIETLKSLIQREGLAAGHRLPTERELSETLMVSRNIVRAALAALEAEGIVSREVGKGTFVRQADHTTTPDTVRVTVDRATTTPHSRREARLALEMGALEFVVERITEAELAELERIVAAHAARWAAGLPAVKEDIDFHTVLLKATRNPILLDMSGLVMDGLREGMLDTPSGLYRTYHDDLVGHRALVAALRRRDLGLARAVLHAHITRTEFPLDLAEQAADAEPLHLHLPRPMDSNPNGDGGPNAAA